MRVSEKHHVGAIYWIAVDWLQLKCVAYVFFSSRTVSKTFENMWSGIYIYIY